MFYVSSFVITIILDLLTLMIIQIRTFKCKLWEHMHYTIQNLEVSIICFVFWGAGGGIIEINTLKIPGPIFFVPVQPWTWIMHDWNCKKAWVLFTSVRYLEKSYIVQQYWQN